MIEEIKKQNFLNKLEENLLSTRKYKNTWITILCLSILFICLTIVTIVYQYYPNHLPSVVENMKTNSSYVIGSRVLVFLSYAVFAIPYLFLSGCWISGVNNVTKSKYFHLFLWISYTLMYIFVIISIILSFRSGMI